jgi:hypothetical protein
MRCAFKDCTNEADPARPESGPVDDYLCPEHDEIQKGDPPFIDPNPHINPTKETTHP